MSRGPASSPLAVSDPAALPASRTIARATRRWIIAAKGMDWFKDKFLHYLTPVTITALLATLILLFSFKGEVILANPLTILWIAVPLFVQTVFVFVLGYGLDFSEQYRNLSQIHELIPESE